MCCHLALRACTCLCIVTLCSHDLACGTIGQTLQVLNVLDAHFIASGDIPGPSGRAAAPPGPRDLLWVLQSTDHRCTHIDTLPTVNPVEAALR